MRKIVDIKRELDTLRWKAHKRVDELLDEMLELTKK